MRTTKIDIEDDFQLLGSGMLEDPTGQWELDISLARIAIENVAVVPFEDGQEIAYGGIQTVLRQTGSATGYLKYMIVDYSCDDITTNSPI